MIEKIIGFSLRQRTLVLVVLALVVGVGVYSFLTLPIDAFPDVTNIQVEVVNTAPGLSPLEIEKFVTYPVEIAMRGLPGLDVMRSVTKYGISVVTLVFDDRTDIYFARQLVFQRLSEAKDSLPEGVRSEMGPVATAMGEIYQYTLEGGPEPVGDAGLEAKLTELRTVQDWVLTPQLKSVPGVSEVNSFGGYIRQFQVVMDPDRLLAFYLRHVIDMRIGGLVVRNTMAAFAHGGLGFSRLRIAYGCLRERGQSQQQQYESQYCFHRSHSSRLLRIEGFPPLRTRISGSSTLLATNSWRSVQNEGIPPRVLR